MTQTDLIVTPATLADAPGIIDVLYEAFASPQFDEVFSTLPEGRAWQVGAYESFIRSESECGKQHSRVFVVKDETGKTVGFAVYWIIDPKNSDFLSFKKRWPATIACQDGEKIDVLFGAMEKNHEKVMGDEVHVFLETIAVANSVRGRGIAAKMLQVGQQMADDLDLPSYLDAAKKAVTLYQRGGYIIQETGLPCKSIPMMRPRKSEREAAV